MPDCAGRAQGPIDGALLALQREEGDLFYLWRVPVADIGQVKENPLATIRAQEEEGAADSFTPTGVGPEAVVCAREH